MTGPGRLLDRVAEHADAAAQHRDEDRADLYAEICNRVAALTPRRGIPASWLLAAAVAGYTLGSVLARRGAR